MLTNKKQTNIAIAIAMFAIILSLANIVFVVQLEQRNREFDRQAEILYIKYQQMIEDLGE